MVKRLVFAALAIGVLATAVYFLQDWYISSQKDALSYSLPSIYYFHFVAFLIIIVSIELLCTIIPNQVGFVYLASVFIKIGFFVLLFNDTIFSDAPLMKYEKIAIVIPFFMFLMAEALYSGLLMNKR